LSSLHYSTNEAVLDSRKEKGMYYLEIYKRTDKIYYFHLLFSFICILKIKFYIFLNNYSVIKNTYDDLNCK